MSLAGELTGGNVRYAATTAPTVSSVTPNHGDSIGGDALVIAGTHLNEVTIVQIGGRTCTGIVHTSDIRLDCVSPIGAVGASVLTVRNRGGNATKAYTFDDSVVIDTIDPDTGDEAGGDVVTITFTKAVAAYVESVTFDGEDGTDITVLSPTSISVVTPAGTGAVDVVVDCGDIGSDTAAGGFTYA